MHPRLTATSIPALSLALVAALAACGGGKSPGVANLGPTTTGSSAVAPPGGGGSAGGGGPSLSLKVSNGAKFSACMRAHGVPSFPDPSKDGGIQIGPGSGIDPSSPKFQSAQQTCRKLLPNGGRPSPAQLAKAQKALLAFSACMRKHGLPDFPDPTFANGGVSMKLRGGPGSDLDPRSPRFQAAQKACRSALPGNIGVGGGGAK